MEIKGQHIIEKVKVDVDVTSTHLAEKIKDEISDFIQNEVLPIIESYLDNALPTEEGVETTFRDKVVQLDKLELNIDTDSWNVNSGVLRSEMRAEVEEKLRPMLQTARGKAQSSRDQDMSSQDSSFSKDDVRVMTNDQRLLNTFFHFLETGTLPWWIQSTEESRELFTDKRMLEVVAENPESVRHYFQQKANATNIHNRLKKQFSPSVVLKCMEVQLSESLKNGEMDVSSVKRLIHKVPNEITAHVLDILWGFTQTRVTGSRLFQKDIANGVFHHAQERLFQGESEMRKMDLSFSLAYHTFYGLNVLSGQHLESSTIKEFLIHALEKELSPQQKYILQDGQTYKKEFLGRVEFKETIEKADSNAEQILNTEGAVNTIGNPQEPSHLLESEKVDQDTIGKEPDAEEEIYQAKEFNDQGESQSDQDILFESEEEISQEEENVLKESLDNQQKSNHYEEEKRAEGARFDEVSISSQKDALTQDETSEENQSVIDNNSDKQLFSEKSNDKISLEEETGNRSKQDEAVNRESTQVDHENENLHSEEEVLTTLQDVFSLESEEDEKYFDQNKAPMPEELFVQNAGLVLLNPFLPALFKQLNLVNEEKKLIQPELAAHILHFAATGREGDFEFEMTFEKYVCGISPGVSLKKEITLTDKQKEEVRKMLSAVLEYWTALKSNSIELLQNEFLSRPGKLVTKSDNHRIIMEKKAFDLLLDKLPWSYSMIKFSWLDNLIFVEW